MSEHLMEPIILIDKSKDKEAHIIAPITNDFEDVVYSAKRINPNLFQGTWSLSYLDSTTQKSIPLSAQEPIKAYLEKGIDTFYWQYQKPAFRFSRRSDYSSRPQFQHANRYSKPTSYATPYKELLYADKGKRLVAFIIDCMVIAMIGAVCARLKPLALFIPIVYFLYAPVFESSSWQATIGKAAMGLRVANTKGEPLQFSTAFIRNIIKYFIPWISGVFIFVTEKQQALHDFVSGTLVLDNEAPSR